MKKATLVIILVFLNGFVSGQVIRGLIAKYYFNYGNANDEVGDNHGVIHGATLTKDRFGNINKAYHFNGIDNYIDLGDSAEFRFSTNFSLSVWFYFNGKEQWAALIGKRYNGHNYNSYVISFINNVFFGGPSKMVKSLIRTDLYEDKFVSVKDNLTPGWHHIVLSNEIKGGSYLYLDGVFQDSSINTHKGLNQVLGSPLLIGGNPDVKHFFDGDIDDILIYNRILPAIEVAALYNEKDPINNISASKILFNWWPGILVAGILIVLILLLIRVKIKIIKKQEKQKAERNMQIRDLEYKALNAQMNPHFIFNCMNSIQRFILANDSKSAYNYMITFSQLIRNVLDNSKSETIVISDEINTLKLYLELEALRFKTKFEYDIIVDDDVELLAEIPPMIIQPFVENAIWHGLMPQTKDKKLSIHFYMLNKGCIKVIIEDSGIGINTSKETKIKNPTTHQPHGMAMIQERLSILNMKHDLALEATITDLQDIDPCLTGTRVELIIPDLNTENN